MAAPVLASLVGQVQTILRTNQRAYISPTEMGFYIDGAQQYLQNFFIGIGGVIPARQTTSGGSKSDNIRRKRITGTPEGAV